MASDQRGQTMILVALMMVALIAAAGFAVDVGNIYLTHRRMQAAADLAALAGAQTLRVTTADAAKGIAYDVADKNGEKAPISTVVVNSPPAHGKFAGLSRYLEVEVSRQVETYFIRVLGFSQVPVSARAVAVVDLDSPPYAVLALSPTARPAIELTGSGNLVTEGAGIMANSTASPAIDHTGSGTVTIDGAVDAAGSIRDQAVYTINTPVMNSYQPPIPDPFANVTFTMPAFDSSTFWDVGPTNVAVGGGDTCVPTGAQYPPTTPCTQAFRPGRYVGGIKITGGTWSFAPGVYVMQGGGLQITGGNVSGGDASGHGVFFYLTTGPGNPDSFNITTNGSVTLWPIRTAHDGVPGNMIFFQDPALSGGNNTATIVANASTSINGTIYVPTNLVTIEGGSSVGVVNGQVIADRVKLAGSTGVSVDYNAASIAAERGSTLVE